MKRGRPTTLPEPWRSLADHCGGVEALAARLGIGRRHLADIANGNKQMSRAVEMLLAQVKAEWIGKTINGFGASMIELASHDGWK